MSTFRLQAPLIASAIAVTCGVSGDIEATGGGSGGAPTTFDGLYAEGFALTALDTAAVTLLGAQAKSSGVGSPSYTDGAYGTKVFVITDYTSDGVDGAGAVGWVRHDYSRRQAWNADRSYYLERGENSYWHLYDGATFDRIPKSGTGTALSGLAGDCEPIWDPTDPAKLYFTGNNGAGAAIYQKVIGSGTSETNTTIGDFTGRLPVGWDVEFVWTKAEGAPSADGDVFSFVVQGPAPGYLPQGIFSWRKSTDTILGTLDAADFGNVMPDHISVSASGTYIVPSWAFTPSLGTRRYALDFSSYVIMHVESVHSDLGFGPSGEDVFVLIDNSGSSGDDGWLLSVDMATNARTRILYTYHSPGGACALHISCKAFDKPGLVVISTYADYYDYGTYPSVPQQAWHNKVMLTKIGSGVIYNVAHTQMGPFTWPGLYWAEPQWTISRDGTRLVGACNWRGSTDTGTVDLMVGLPSWVVDAF